MCQNPPAKLRGYPVKHLSTFGKDFWVIPLDRVGKVQEPSEEEAVDRWPGYPRAYQSLIDHLRLSKPWYRHLSQRGFTKAAGFDLVGAPEAACRGWFVGLVNHRTEQ